MMMMMNGYTTSIVLYHVWYMYGGRNVLLGDAGAPFPPVGQGVNAAMEAAIVLDMCIGLQLGNGGSTADVLEAAAKDFTRAWAPEAAAIRTIARGSNIMQVCSSSQDPLTTYAFESVHCTMRKMEICRTYKRSPSNVTLIAA